MKKLFLVVLAGFFFYSLQAGPRIVRLNCPHMGEVGLFGSNPPIMYNCIHEINGEFHFCLFLQANTGFMPLISIRISINGVNETIPLSDFDTKISGNFIQYNKRYVTTTAVGLNEFDLMVEVLQQNLQGNLVTYTGSHFHTIGYDNSLSINPAVFTANIKVCPPNFNPVIIDISQTCNAPFTITMSPKMANIEEIDKASINKTINDGIINIYPNPFKDHININMLANSSKYININLYDAHGKTVAQITPERINNLALREKIWTTDLPVGLYICEIKNENEQFNFKLLKSN